MRVCFGTLSVLEARNTGDSVCERVIGLLSSKNHRNSAGGVLLFSALWDEPDLSSLRLSLQARGHRVFYPRMISKDAPPILVESFADEQRSRWTPDALGVLSPEGLETSPCEISIAVIPGRAFDSAGNRLGRGGGHFDRLLAMLNPTTVRLGVAFDHQIVARVPAEDHDQKVHLVATPSRTITCNSAVCASMSIA